MNHVMGVDNLLDNADLSVISGTVNSQFPLSNLQIPITSKPLRSTGNTFDFMIDTNTITAADYFMFVGDNKVGIGVSTIKIYGSTTTDFSASDEIVIDISSEYNFGYKNFTESTFRYWKIALTGVSYCELSNLYLGKITQMTTNGFALGSFQYEKRQNKKVRQNKYGNKFITIYNTQKILSGDIKLLDNSEYTTLKEIINDHLTTTPIWFITDPDNYLGTDSEYNYSGFFYFAKDLAFPNDHFQLWSTSLQLVEVT